MALAAESSDSLCFRYQEIFGSAQQASTVVIALGLLIGWLKGRFVLSKTVKRVVDGIAILKTPIRTHQVYSRKYWILIASMIALGMSLRILPIPVDIRGFVDIAVGSALIQGSLLYFRAAKTFICGT